MIRGSTGRQRLSSRANPSIHLATKRHLSAEVFPLPPQWMVLPTGPRRRVQKVALVSFGLCFIRLPAGVSAKIRRLPIWPIWSSRRRHHRWKMTKWMSICHRAATLAMDPQSHLPALREVRDGRANEIDIHDRPRTRRRLEGA